MRLLKQLLLSARDVESRKQILNAHQAFKIEEAHDMLDTNNDGHISVQEINDVLVKYQIEQRGLDALVEMMGKDPEMEINLNKFKEQT